jgi:histidinol phosphatase-like PHP family hydrolase
MIVINSDAHAPADLLDENARQMVALGAGLTGQEAKIALSLNIHRWLSKRA